MDVSYEVKNNYLYITVTGEFDLSSAKNFLSEVMEKAHNHSLNKILCDITHLKGFDAQQTSTETRFNIATFIADAIPIDFRLAILETPMQLIGGRFGENVMADKGVSVKVTPDIEEALEWLGVITYRSKSGDKNR